MPRNPFERPTPYSSASPDGAPRTAHVDYLLRFVIDRSGVQENQAFGRLDAIERTLVALTRPWRADSPLSPVRELRMSTDTLDTLLAWIENGDQPQMPEVERLGVYASGAVTDRSVPDGWVRIRLAS